MVVEWAYLVDSFSEGLMITVGVQAWSHDKSFPIHMSGYRSLAIIWDSAGAIGWNLHVPSPCDLDFFITQWSLRTSIQKTARQKLHHFALGVSVSLLPQPQSCPDLRKDVDSFPTSSWEEYQGHSQRTMKLKNLIAAMLGK